MMPWIEFLFLAMLLVWWGRKVENRSLFAAAAALHLAASLALGWLYFMYYGQGDTIGYWLDAKLLEARWHEDAVQTLRFYWDHQTYHPEWLADLQLSTDRSLFFSKCCGLVSLLAGGSYGGMALIFGTVSFTGSWYLYDVCKAEWKKPLAIALFFWPSTLLWSSGMIKESLALTALLVMTAVLVRWFDARRVSVWEALLFVLGVWISWRLKYYWLGIWLPAAACTVLVDYFVSDQRRVALYWMVCFVSGLALVSLLHPNFHLSRLAAVVVENHDAYVLTSAPDRLIHYGTLDGSFSNLLLNAPWALFSGLFRPFVTEINQPLMAAAALENLVLLVLSVLSVLQIVRRGSSLPRLFHLGVGAYVILLATFLALSTPNLGTLSRFKVGFLPFLVFWLLCHPPWRTEKKS